MVVGLSAEGRHSVALARAMMYARGHRYDYDTWESLGNAGVGLMSRACLTLRS